jgi:hypothetical protein
VQRIDLHLTIRSTVDFDGKVTFYSNGKKIPGCVNHCDFKQSCKLQLETIGQKLQFYFRRLTTVGGNLTSPSVRIFVNKRSTQR